MGLQDYLAQLVGSQELSPLLSGPLLDAGDVIVGDMPEPRLGLQVLGHRLELSGLVVQLELLAVDDLV